jgi:N-hydroxyarylamine O-acetyltransferase
MSAPALDLDGYLERIGYKGTTDPTFETLAGLLRAHVATVPFENLDVLLGRGIRLEVDAVQRKLVRAHRGGYCFEHATLFAAVLECLGFHPVRHTARVVLFSPRTESPRAHMFLTVPLGEGRFVVDPGFGALAPGAPLLLGGAFGAHAGAPAHRMVRDDDYLLLQFLKEDEIVDCWVTTLDQDNLMDFELGNHFTATHPNSPFVNRIMMSALTSDGRVTLMNRDLTTWRGKDSYLTQLADRAALRALLVEHFGFDLPEVERLRVPSIPEWT